MQWCWWPYSSLKSCYVCSALIETRAVFPRLFRARSIDFVFSVILYLYIVVYCDLRGWINGNAEALHRVLLRAYQYDSINSSTMQYGLYCTLTIIMSHNYCTVVRINWKRWCHSAQLIWNNYFERQFLKLIVQFSRFSLILYSQNISEYRKQFGFREGFRDLSWFFHITVMQ